MRVSLLPKVSRCLFSAWRRAQWFGACLLVFCCFAAFGGSTREQSIALRAGWNAVYLEVEPEDPRPSTVFAATPIDIAAALSASVSSAQYITDPGVGLFRQDGWGVWYSANRPDAFLRTLHGIYGQQAYLIHSKIDFTWTLSGTVPMQRVKWKPDAYNFVGFSVVSPGAPTFAQFFSGSGAHNHNQIYRLANGSWRRVATPSAESMVAGEAFWIFCDGASEFQGPLKVETTTSQGLILGENEDAIILRNNSGHPVTPTLEHVVVGGNSVPLSILILTTDTPDAAVTSVAAAKPDGPWTQPLPPIEAGTSIRVPFEVRLQDMHAANQYSLIKVSTDGGTVAWVPVTAFRNDLQEP